MFHKIKKFKDMRSQAKKIQDVLAQESVTVENHGIKLIMDGNQKVLSMSIEENKSAKEIEKKMPDIFNSAIKKVQRVMATKMQGMGGLDSFGMQ